MFQIMHDFWIQQFPMFVNKFELFYIIMDFLTAIVFIRIMIFELPSIFGGRKI